MDEDFLKKLNNYEKEIYQKYQKSSGDKFSTNLSNIISPLNDLIYFNPFQYEPYYKLTQQKEYPKAIYIADEVGSGKTIETGIILTELIYHNEFNLSEDICIIVCPNLLCRKWRDTLKSLFGIGATIVYSIKDVGIGINILSYDTVSKNHEEINLIYKLLIIDEAHNTSGDRYEKICSIRKNIDKEKGYIILLSATPLSGKENDERKQIELLKETLKIEDFFSSDSVYLCKNKKMSMRYVANPYNYEVNVEINNHFIENPELILFKECCSEIFSGKNTLLQFQGLNMIMSSPQSGLLFMQRILDKSDEELLEYLLTSQEEYDIDYEGEDEDYKDIEKKEYTLDDVKCIRNKFEKVGLKLCEISTGKKEDKKFNELLNVIKNNKNEFEKQDRESIFYNHIIVFTDRLSTAEYLEKELNKQKEIPCKIFRVTGELFESEKRARIMQYENVDDKMSILIITNVACEGQDMDYGNTIVNYDLDYNPVRLEQRRGRIDRFEVKKKKIYIHNFMVDKYDYDPNKPEKEYDGYSKVKKISDKIDNIYRSTGTYYEVLRKDENKIKTDENELYKIKQEVFTHIRELGKVDNSVKIESLFDLYKSVISVCISQFGKYEDVYQLVSDTLKTVNIKIEKNDDNQIIIKTTKNNKDFLNNVYVGGTLISHLLLGGR